MLTLQFIPLSDTAPAPLESPQASSRLAAAIQANTNIHIKSLKALVCHAPGAPALLFKLADLAFLNNTRDF